MIGTSAGGFGALTALLQPLTTGYPVPLIVVQHRSKDQKDLLEDVLQQMCAIRIRQAEEKELITSGVVYIAPANYHLLVEADHRFSLSSDALVNFSRPSIDVLFESAAEFYRNALAGIVLTGSNRDGAAGVKAINRYGGITIAQDPGEAQFPEMPTAAIKSGAKNIFQLSQIRNFLFETGHE